MDLVLDLKVALTIARTKSLSATARELNMTVPTVSRRLDGLEATLNVRLFNRTTKGLFITDEGDAILVDGQELVERADELISRNSFGSQGLSGVLRVTAPARFGQLYIAPVAAEFMKEHPNLSIDLACTDQVQNIGESGFDLAIRIGRLGQDNNIIRKIASNKRILVAAPQWVKANPMPTNISELDGCDGLMLGHESSWKLKSLENLEIEIKPHVRFRSRFGDVIREVCEAGCGIALKSIWDVAPAIKDRSLVRLFPNYEQNQTSDISLVLPSRRFVSERVQAFSRAIERSLGKNMTM